jgi:hypothetical protein
MQHKNQPAKLQMHIFLKLFYKLKYLATRSTSVSWANKEVWYTYLKEFLSKNYGKRRNKTHKEESMTLFADL